MSAMDLNTPIYKLSDKDVMTLDDCTCGTVIFGATGSGKSSGSGRLIAKSYLRKGMGGLVLTAKNDEKETWIKYAQETGRIDDLVIFGPKDFQFNPLNYEMERAEEGAGESGNIVAMCLTIMKMNGRVGATQNQGSSQDPFWDYAQERLLKAAIDLIKLSGNKLTMANIVRIVSDAPIEPEILADNSNRRYTYIEKFSILIQSEDHEHKNLLDEWCEKNFTVSCLAYAHFNAKTPMEERIYDTAKSYFLSEFSRLGQKTRTGITEQLYAFVNPFRSGLLAECFTEGTSPDVLPEETFTRKIILLDFPVKKYLNVGIIAQALYKYIWQQAVERRDLNRYPMPVFLFADEAQLFCNQQDMMFQETARSSKACTVLLTQNLSNFYAAIGGRDPRDYVHSLLGNLNTKIFHANTDPITNEFAASIIGQTFQSKDSFNYSPGSAGGSFSEQKHFQVEPLEFTTMKRGGSQNDFKVEGIVVSAGTTFSNKKNYLKTTFNQNI